MSNAAQPAIAIIGMAGRFPGAIDINQFWDNIRTGVESISTFTDEQLRTAGNSEEFLRNPQHVCRMGALTDTDLFDAEFFGYSAREATVMDPQQRLFLHCAWHALEHAGYDPRNTREDVGVYAGLGINRYLHYFFQRYPDLADRLGELELIIGSDKDFLATRVAYKLNLKGPAFTLQTACSTSLAAVVMACQSLLCFNCDVALAGGVTIHTPSPNGYIFQQGGTLSPDGCCRPFDAKAQGMVPGNGVGLVVLKRFEEALLDGDSIYAVIRAAAVNNDGARKVGYTAPSVDGQAQVIRLTHALAAIEPASISYIEAHGTGTDLGDPIEIAGLKQAFGPGLPSKSIAVGSVKSNVGHLDTAAGVAGLIKTALALHHRELPPTLHFEKANPKLELSDSPFFINDKLRPWETGHLPRRAGVSSFGIGGTNAHVLLEEAPAIAPSISCKQAQLLLLSARTSAALRTACGNLAHHLQDHPDINLADAAYTLQIGRSPMPCRAAFVCGNATEAVGTLLHEQNAGFATRDSSVAPEVAFVFPGQGSQHANMAKDLYENDPIFRHEMDVCFDILKPLLNFDLRDLLWPTNHSDPAALDPTAIAQPALFALEYSLARRWMHLGIQPVALLGHSIGEYVAACLAGVFSLSDALRLVVTRGRLMQRMVPGAMLSVPLPAGQVQSYLDSDLAVCVINEANSTVIGGSIENISRLEERLAQTGTKAQRLRTSHAFHSPSMEPALEEFMQAFAGVSLHPPAIPVLSNRSGTWLTAQQAASPLYWADHLRNTVQFHACLTTLLNNPRRVILEVGPGTTLTTFATRHELTNAKNHIPVATCRHPKQLISDDRALLTALGQMWLHGIQPKWTALHDGQIRRRIALPGYPFEGRRYWLSDLLGTPAPLAAPNSVQPQRRQLSECFYLPVWRGSELPPAPSIPKSLRCLIFGTSALAGEIANRLKAIGHTVDLKAQTGLVMEPLPDLIFDLCDFTPFSATPLDRAHQTLSRVLAIIQPLAKRVSKTPIRYLFLTESLQSVLGSESKDPARAAAIGGLRAACREIPGLQFQAIDVDDLSEHLADRLLNELSIASPEPVIAYRGKRRFVQDMQQIALPASNPSSLLESGATYLVTGGLRGIGLALALAIAERCQAHLILVGRSVPPRREQWDDLNPESKTSWHETIAAIQTMERGGSQVLIHSADVASFAALQGAFDAGVRHFGKIDGVIHAAGVAPGGAIAFRKPADMLPVLAGKLGGAQNIATIVSHLNPPLKFVALCSSLAAVIGVSGQFDYSGANAALDSLAGTASTSATRWVSINWDTWSQTGMAFVAGVRSPAHVAQQDALAHGLKTSDGAEAFFRILAQPWPQVLVSLRPLTERLRIDSLSPPSHGVHPNGSDGNLREGPQLPSDHITQVWREFLGVQNPSLTDDFFQLGGHSLLAVQMAHHIQSLLGITITPDALFAAPTLGALIQYVAQQPSTLSTSQAQTAIPASGPESYNVDTREEELLKMIESMSDEQVQAFLEQELATPAAKISEAHNSPHVAAVKSDSSHPNPGVK